MTTEQTTARSDGNVSHVIASNLEDIKARVGLTGRALCGAQLKLRDDAELPTDDAPTCPRCEALNR